ncbi:MULTISPECIES: copper-binding protein [Burkholderia]|uniref:RND transporter MFP subunit n=1 Tax=Burkholderia savannae TaxID=1637837 RepID=A0ABR5THD9_9BURK|nr:MULTISPECIES: copper-binding protein [Burkholderia]AOJ70261.1 RND transporter MFP subunit [Burkholderia savannae]AOJ82231.1 RND transporter MFP subunit [Burkholderia savannae]AOK48377.1 RND transporter MFP subunit [Burkholderia sp. MSMB617WGS]KGS01588.1 copper binding periplasmic CusF family protein [Burkholderia sp. ABCPW 111]KVG38812.1 RND transporter MFP subunit [Burkholderia sp. MSMB0265]
MKQSIVLLITLAAAAAPAIAADGMAGMNMPMSSHDASRQSDAALTDAVVRKVDPAAGMVTLEHGALDNVGMPPMTMAFKAKDAEMAARVRAGDKVRVRVENVGGVPTIVKLEK